MPIDSKWIVNLSGKDFVQWGGLLDLAHQNGLKSLRTELVQAPNEANGNLAIFKAEAEFTDGRVFATYGDASPTNVNVRIAPHFVRMAETRAKGRCLRDACNIGQTMLEELADADAEAQSAGNGRAAQAKAPAPPARTAQAQKPEAAADDPRGGYYKDAKGKLWERAQLVDAARSFIRRAEALAIPHQVLDPMTATNQVLHDFGREMSSLVRAREQELKAEKAATS